MTWWPAPTHSKDGSSNLFGPRQRYASARDHVIDWSIKGKSIFNRKRPLKPATIARILAGLKKFGGPELQPFIVAMEHGGRVLDIDSPLPTITTAKGGAFAVAQPFLVQFKGTAESQIPSTAQDIDQPVGTLTASGADFGVVEPFLLHATHGGRVNDVDEPLPTVTCAHRGEIGLVEPFVLQQQSGGAPRSVEQPLPTIACGGAISLIEPFLVSAGGPIGQGRTPNSVDEPLPTVLTENHRALIEPYLTKYYGSGEGVSSTSEPVPTVTTKDRFALVEPFILSAGGPEVGARPVSEPMNTVLTRDHMALAEPFIVPPRYLSKDERVDSVDEPLRTITAASGRCFGLVQPVIDGYVLDIHFRMLQPHELAAAMSFPKEYVFTGTREDVVKQIGNSWAGELSKALCMAVLSEAKPQRKRKAA
jgi:DNA (cytosine-5)-methyltransferase 1